MSRVSILSVSIVIILGSSVAFAQDAPVAFGDAYDIHFGETLTVDAPGVLANDTGAVSAELANDYTTDLGTLTFNTDGSFSFTLTLEGLPDGTNLAFTYRALNGSGGASPDMSVLLTVRTEGGDPAPDPTPDPTPDPAGDPVVSAPLLEGGGSHVGDNDSGDHAINDTLCGGTIGAAPMMWWPLALMALALRRRRR